MKKCKSLILAACSVLSLSLSASAQTTFRLNSGGYFNAGGVDVMAFDDYYPEGHQGGICLIMNGKRIATNGDIRFEPTPGQWQPVPKKVKREIVGNKIITSLAYPDSSRHMTGFNPMLYPDMQLTYSVTLESCGKGLVVTVDLDQEIPERFLGKVGFNLEFFPGFLFGKPWIMDDKTGVFPRQANAPLDLSESYTEHLGNFHPSGRSEVRDLARLERGAYDPLTADRIVAAPYAVGKVFTVLADDPLGRLKITSETGDMKLYDGRMNHNNGWFVLRSEIARGVKKGAVKWYIEPNVVDDWRYPAVVQTSQVGYHPSQPKVAVIEIDGRDDAQAVARLFRITADGEKFVKSIATRTWNGDFFLRYKYLQADFSNVTEPGLYRLRYAGSESSLFRIDDDIYDRGVWQPVLEYFLPVQMCHMRVMDKYRVWHDACHMDDALYAEDGSHIDGYDQVPGIPTKYRPREVVPGLNVGGWHDAGDFDLRVESQIGESYILSLAYENFKPELDVTSIDYDNHQVEIHQPDGRNDLLQQVENGALTVVNGYLALGRLYRGIICNSLRQYVLLGDAAAMTDGIVGNEDDRWVFTEKNPRREISVAAGLAASARVLRNFNDTLATHCENIAKEIFDNTDTDGRGDPMKIQAAVELYFTTKDARYFNFVMENWSSVVSGVPGSGWYTQRIARELEGRKKYRKQLAVYKEALAKYAENLKIQTAASPYGVPYRPDIWGAGWAVQSFGYNYYFLADAYPELFPAETVFNALNFVLGCHPGTNQASFASGVGTKSATVGYGLNRADWSYIPGGVISGTAVIRPDFPELLEWPYLWQQTEYVLGGGSSHYMFLVLAAQKLALNGNSRPSRAQADNTLDRLKTVYKDNNVTFRELNDSTWLGSGNVMSSESMYLIEGKDKAVLIDAGTEIPGLDRIVAGITDKPVMLVLTHVHPDHAGSAGCFDQVWIGPGDTVNVSRDMPDYKGEVKYLRNRDIIDLGGRSLEVYFTPGHTPGSVTFLEKGTEYGYCGDSFGTGQGFKNGGILIFCEDLGTIINTCSESYRYFRDNGYRKLYCGHFYGSNFVTEERISFVEKAVSRLKNGELEVTPFDGVFNLNRMALCDGYKIRFVGAEQP